MDFWKSEEAEQRFGEVMHRALTNAPQTVLGPDGTAVVVMSDDEHYHLILALQRLLELGETPPVAPKLRPGERNAWDFIQSLPPAEELRQAGLPSDYFARVREESRHCACCASRESNRLTTNLAG